MRLLKKFFDFYISASLHVALSVYALVRLTQFFFALAPQTEVAVFAFLGTIVGYNFIKYDALARNGSKPVGKQIWAIAVLSFVSFCGALYFFFQLQTTTRYWVGVFLLFTLLYTLPFFPNRKNARNWAGVKIYIVSLCWVGVTVVLPVVEAGHAWGMDFYLKCLQRFLLVFVLVLVFEIIDLQTDDPHLKTVPQQIGVGNTKRLGYFLLLVFCLLECVRSGFTSPPNPAGIRFLAPFIVGGITAFFLYFADEKKPKYYTAFWAEGIPVLWWGLVVFAHQLCL